jgi:hypothetical protein
MIANAAAMSKPAAWLLAACDCVGLMQVVPAAGFEPATNGLQKRSTGMQC